MFENAQWGKVRATVVMKYKGKDERLIERGDGYKCWCQFEDIFENAQWGNTWGRMSAAMVINVGARLSSVRQCAAVLPQG